MIYLDNAATTSVLEEAFNAASLAAYECYGNPSSIHNAGRKAAKLVEDVRKQIADFIGANSEEIIFTSGGTESDNLALLGVAPYLKSVDKITIITSLIEHHAVLNTCKELEKDGFRIIYTSFQVLNKKSESSLKKQYNESNK